MEQNIVIAGATFNGVPSIEIPTSGGGSASFVEVSDTTATAADVAQGKYFYTAAGVKTAGAGEGSAVVQPLTITENGTYTPPSGVDGYAPVTVNVSGGTDSTFSFGAPSSTSGFNDGDYFYQRVNGSYAYDLSNVKWDSAGSIYSTGNKFSCSESVTICGIWFYARRAIADVYLSLADGTQIAHKTLSNAISNSGNIVWLDEPVTLNANTDYVVWYCNNGAGAYKSMKKTPVDSRFQHIVSVYASGLNNFPSTTIPENIYPVDLIAINSNIDPYIARQWRLKNGIWTQLSSL